MPEGQEEHSNDAEEIKGTKRAQWFRPNRSGPGWHPSSWQGWLIAVVAVGAIVTVVALLRTGVL